MSISNLFGSDANAVQIPCTVSGAITGPGTLNFKRLDNIVYMSFLIPSQTVGVAGPTITITASMTIPIQYRPVAGVVRIISVASNAIFEAGTISFPNTLTTFTVSLLAGGNFTGTSAIIDNVILWAVPSI